MGKFNVVIKSKIVLQILMSWVLVSSVIPNPAQAENSLLQAVLLEEYDMIPALIQAGAPVNEQDEEGYTALMYASMQGMAPLVHFLLAAGAHPNLQSDGVQETALTLAISSNSEDVVHLLIRGGAAVDFKNRLGKTPLHLAAEGDCSPRIVQKLLQNGANPKERDLSGHTPLDLAAKSGPIWMNYLLFKASGELNSVRSPEELRKVGTPGANYVAQYLKISALKTVQEGIELKAEIQNGLETCGSAQDREAYLWLKGLLKTKLEEVYLEEQALDAISRTLRKVECPICKSDQTLPQVELNGRGPADCGCYVCPECVPRWLKSDLREKGGSLIQCPQCSGTVTLRYLRSKAENGEQLKRLIRHQGEASGVGVEEGYLHCPTSNCVGKRRRLGETSDPNYFSCALCDFSGCIECKKDHHGFCAEAERERVATQARLQNLLEKGKLAPPEAGYPESPDDPHYLDGRWRPCYYCGLITERADGCNGMKCAHPSCKKDWHWNYGDHRKHPLWSEGVLVHDYEKLERRYEPLVPARL